jgi:hypothetical protein
MRCVRRQAEGNKLEEVRRCDSWTIVCAEFEHEVGSPGFGWDDFQNKYLYQNISVWLLKDESRVYDIK